METEHRSQENGKVLVPLLSYPNTHRDKNMVFLTSGININESSKLIRRIAMR